MLLGIDYAKWSAFPYQTLFPRAADYFHAFPSSQVANQVIEDWPQYRDSDVADTVSSLFGVYLLALSKGFPRYELGVKAAAKTLGFVRDQSGYPQGRVVAFLSTLEKMAKLGTIAREYWDPVVAKAANKASSDTLKAVRKAAPRSKARTDVSEAVSVVAEAGSGLTNFVKWAAVGVVGFMGVMVVSKIPRMRRKA